MRFPSVKNLALGALTTFKRFPFEICFALAGTIAATVKIELTQLNRVTENWSLRVIMIANLGLLLSLSASLFAESKALTRGKKTLLRFIAAIISVLLIFIIDPGERGSDYIRFLLFSLSFHLLVAFAAFTDKGHLQGFWQFNKTLFLRFLTSALYGAVLFLGLAAAIGAMNFLFNFKFEWDTFANLWVWIVGMFATIFFLSGIPHHLGSLEEDLSYPKGLKVFTQYVLIPLATVYVIILLAYEAKILVEWQLPKGLVSNLILGYAVFGILSLLLVYPIREQEENKWLKTYTRSFYFLLIPLLGLLFTAVGTRVFRYGITEMRYFLVVLACWLLFITVYFLITRRQNIKLIPVSLSILTLLSIYGPQSAFSVSMYSQRRILINVFKKNNAYKDGRLVGVDSTKISLKDAHKAVATLDYLIAKHDLTSLQPYFKQDLDKVNDSLSKIKSKWNPNGPITDYEFGANKLEWAKKQLNLGKFSGYYRDGYDESDTTDVDYPETYIFNNNHSNAYAVNGYDYLLQMDNAVSDTTVSTVNGLKIMSTTLGSGLLNLKVGNEALTFNISANLDSLTNKNVQKNYEPAYQGATSSFILPNDKLVFTKSSKGYKVTLKITMVNVSKAKKVSVNNIGGYYLIKKL